jgi:Icc-related predicted phosphoesterase
MIVDCISDLHGFYPQLEGGDLLIVAGDLTATHSFEQLMRFYCWFDKQDYKKRILIAGNHDGLLEEFPPTYGTWEYLCDSGAEFEYIEPSLIFSINEKPIIGLGETKILKIWGSPWTKTFPNMNPRCKAFTCDTEKELNEKWALIPEDVDILITHSPPYGIMDAVQRYDFDHNSTIENCGSVSLMNRLYSEKIKPKLHVFGHIHEGHGHIQKMMDYPGVQFVNASYVNERYQPVNKPIRIIL